MRSESAIYFIRHARSTYNSAETALKELLQLGNDQLFEKSSDYQKMKFNLDLEDCDIAPEIGDKECLECRGKMNKIDLDLIIVSPMRRALATCHKVLTDHHSKAPVIVDPLFREIVESSCDIGSRLRESMLDYPEFDYSLITDVDAWYIHTLVNQQDRNELLAKLKDYSGSQRTNEAKELMLEYLKNLWTRRKADESLKQLALSPVTAQKQKLKLLMKKYKSIAIVTHSENIKSYIGEKPENCAIFKYKPQFFDMEISSIPIQYL